MDWESLYCSNRHCQYYGMVSFLGKAVLVKNGSTRGQKQAKCQSCGCRVALKYATAYYDLNINPTIFETPIGALAEGIPFEQRLESLRSTKIQSVIGSIAPLTIADWSCYISGMICKSANASLMNFGVLFTSKREIFQTL